jgi:hypothetical protein
LFLGLRIHSPSTISIGLKKLILNVATTYAFPLTDLPQQIFPFSGLNFADKPNVVQSEFILGKIVGVLDGVLVLVGE